MPADGKRVTDVLYLAEQEGEGTTEYALILVAVVIIVLAVLMILGPRIGNSFSHVSSNLEGLPQ